jgi:L-threonylcarbamoyladenylate synthase
MTARIVADGPDGRRAAIAALHAGEVVAIPTDTVYGIAVSGSTPGGLERLFAAKGRPPDKAIVLLLADLDQVAALAVTTPTSEALARAFWPGGLTLVLARRSGLDPDAPSAETVGLRVPDHEAPRTIARALGPLPTTSANRSGEPEARDAGEIAATFGEAVALVLDGGPAPGGPASTVVDASGPIARILRPGAISERRIAAALRAAGLAEPVGR